MVNEYLIKLFQTIKEMEELDLFSDVGNLTRTEFRLIREIVLEEEKGKKIISSELARRLGITRSAVSQLVTKLEARGIVARTAAEHDRKIAYVILSDRARSIFNAQCAKANEVMETVAEKYGAARLNKLIEDYNDFSKAFVEARKAQAEKQEGSENVF